MPVQGPTLENEYFLPPEIRYEMGLERSRSQVPSRGTLGRRE
jgi:hypothetical protein